MKAIIPRLKSLQEPKDSLTTHDLILFALLVAIGVAGRLAPLTWNFTPMAAITIVGAIYFRRALMAFLLPVCVLAISNLMLPAHDSYPVMLTVYAMMIVPLLLGRKARKSRGWERLVVGGLCGIVPATTFYVVTNFAVWAFKSSYEPTVAGLAACYAAGIPFYRAMLVGDLFYLSLLLACFAVARVNVPVARQSV